MFLHVFVFPVYDLFSSSFRMQVSEVFVKKICSIWGGKEEGCFSCFFQLSGSWADADIGLALLPYLGDCNSITFKTMAPLKQQLFRDQL